MKGPIEYIVEAWKIYTKKENFIFFAKIMAVVLLLSTAVGFVSGYLYPEDYLRVGDFSDTPMLVGFILLTLAMILIGLWSQTTIYFSVLKIGDSEKNIFRLGYQKMWDFFFISLVMVVIILLGAVLLIIPAIIFGIWYSFSILLVLDKNMGIGQALKTSKTMVTGNFWKVLGRFLVFGIFSAIVSVVITIIPFVGPLIVSFVTPFFMLPSYLLYRDLSASS